MTNHYDARNIQVLEGLDAVRMRPGMYIGSTGSRGLHHMLWEIVDNSIDEAMAGFATRVDVTLGRDGSVTVEDNGRGMPVDIHPTMGVSGVEVIYTKLHAGGKFNSENYAYSGGLHGVGASVVNALSRWVEVDVCRDFQHWHIRFESAWDEKEKKIVAGRATGPLTLVGNTKERGSRVRFLPDDRVFETVRFNAETVSRRLRELAYLNRGLTITFLDEREPQDEGDAGEGPRAPEREVYRFDGGLVDYVRYLNADKTPLHEEPIYLAGQREDVIFRVAIQYTDSYTENVFSYVNNIPTAEGGTHETGFKAAYTKVMNDFARRLGVLRDKDANLSGDDFREGMTAVMLAMVKNPQFEGQTKGKLGNTEVRPLVEAILTQQLTAYFEDLKHQELAQQIIEKAVRAARVREAARKARDVARTKSALEAAPLVGKLSSCTGRKAEQNELFIVEGDSAGGSAKQGRDRRDSAAARKAAQRREKAPRSGAGQRGVPLHHHGAGNEHRREFLAGGAQVQQGHHPLGRRSGRGAYPRHSADLLLPLHEGAHHRGTCVHRHAAALQGAKGQQGAVRLRRRGASKAHARADQGLHPPALQGPGRDEPGAAVADHHGPRTAKADAGEHRGRGAGRAAGHHPHGGQGGAAQAVHQPARQL